MNNSQHKTYKIKLIKVSFNIQCLYTLVSINKLELIFALELTVTYIFIGLSLGALIKLSVLVDI